MLTMLLGAIELATSRGSFGPAEHRAARALAARIARRRPTGLSTPFATTTCCSSIHRSAASSSPSGAARDPSWDTLVFYLLAALALAAVVWGRRRLTLFDMAALGLTFAGAVLAIRGIPWFALTCLVLVPVALGPLLEERTKRTPRALDRGLSYGAVAVLAVVAVVALARDEDWYLKNWPEGAVSAVRDSLTTPETRVFATSRDADWILWRIPELRGRLAYDVRFEIYDRETFERIVRFRGEQGE